MTKSKINICIVHYNADEALKGLLKSINKYTPDCTIYIFDNSDRTPLTYRQDNMVYYDNTKGQIINFNKWLSHFRKNPDAGKNNKWGSAKHCYSVEKCMDLINDDFILLDDDILLKRDISQLYDSNYVYVGDIAKQNNGVSRLLPFICYINVGMCKKNGIHFFNEKYMHGLYTSKESNKYDTGAWFHLACEKAKLPHKEIKHDKYIVHYKGGSWVQNSKTTKINITDWLNKYKMYWDTDINTNLKRFPNLDTEPKDKTVVYTCITGAYDNLLVYSAINKDVDYVCFTDNPNLKSNYWNVVYIGNDKELMSLSQVKKQRYIKINAHKFLYMYDRSIWVDANINIVGNINELLNIVLENNVDVYIPKHPVRDCIYQEVDACVIHKKDVYENMNPQKDRYISEGFPTHYGLVQTGIMIRNHNSQYCTDLMTMWWEELSKGSHRDQLSFNYVLWKLSPNRFKYLDKNLFESKWFGYMSHSFSAGEKKIGNITYYDGMESINATPKPTPEQSVKEQNVKQPVIEEKKIPKQQVSKPRKEEEIIILDIPVIPQKQETPIANTQKQNTAPQQVTTISTPVKPTQAVKEPEQKPAQVKNTHYNPINTNIPQRRSVKITSSPKVEKNEYTAYPNVRVENNVKNNGPRVMMHGSANPIHMSVKPQPTVNKVAPRNQASTALKPAGVVTLSSPPRPVAPQPRPHQPTPKVTQVVSPQVSVQQSTKSPQPYLLKNANIVVITYKDRPTDVIPEFDRTPNTDYICITNVPMNTGSWVNETKSGNIDDIVKSYRNYEIVILVSPNITKKISSNLGVIYDTIRKNDIYLYQMKDNKVVIPHNFIINNKVASRKTGIVLLSQLKSQNIY